MTCNLPIVYDQPNWLPAIKADPEHVTEDQQGCNQYLSWLMGSWKRDPAPNILHVGVGTSSIYKQFGRRSDFITGVTVLAVESDLAHRLAVTASCPYIVLVCNKYNSEQLEAVWRVRNPSRKFDYIVDNNLKQHACCQEHWEDYFRNLLFNFLEIGGSIITHTQGFAPHTSRITALTIEELKRLSGPCVEVIEGTQFTNKHGHYPVEIKCQG